RGRGSKRKPPGNNQADRGCNITPRETGLTSLGSGVTREPGQQTSGGDAEMSQATTLAGAAPGLGVGADSRNGKTVYARVRLLQAGIVKVSSGKRWQPEPWRS